MSELAKRIAVAVAGIPLMLFVIYQGGIAFALAVVIISAIGLREMYDMTEKKNMRPDKWYGLCFGAAMQILLFAGLGSTDTGKAFAGLFALFVLFVGGALIIQLFNGKDNPIGNTFATIGGVMYVPTLLASLIGIREFHKLAEWAGGLGAGHGEAYFSDGGSFMFLVLIVFVSVWICDSAAYFVGRAIGRHKMFPSVSPKKSWEGTAAGLVGSVAGFTGFAAWLIPSMPIRDSLVMGLLAGVLGQIGDLAESRLKRDAGVKDSSHIIPGHGGVLDRFDSILFVAPAVFIYMLVRVLLS